MSQSTHTAKRQVSFLATGDTVIPDSIFHQQRHKEDLKELWYSREELMDSCNEAKTIVKMIHVADGKLEEIDDSIHCVVGLEKYHARKEREKYRKMLIRSVLIRQEMNRGLGLGTSENGCLSEISQMMSSSFKDFALWQAALHEFHAYGSTKPSQALFTKNTIARKTRPPSSLVRKCAKRPRQQMLESCFVGARAAKKSRNTDNQTFALNNCNKDSLTVHTVPLPNAQKDQELHRDMIKVMEGYVERKRFRSEFRGLVSPSYPAPLSHVSIATETPLLQTARR